MPNYAITIPRHHHHPSPYLTTHQSPSLFLIIPHRPTSFLTIPHHPSPALTIPHHPSSPAPTIPHHFSPSLTIPHNSSSRNVYRGNFLFIIKIVGKKVFKGQALNQANKATISKLSKIETKRPNLDMV